MEIGIKKYQQCKYKGVNYLRTQFPIYGSVKNGNRFYGLGRGGFEYYIMEGDTTKVFYTLSDVQKYINALINFRQAKSVMDKIAGCTFPL